jgi:hypothetical protein
MSQDQLLQELRQLRRDLPQLIADAVHQGLVSTNTGDQRVRPKTFDGHNLPDVGHDTTSRGVAEARLTLQEALRNARNKREDA